jgi:hypothetical protein
VALTDMVALRAICDRVVSDAAAARRQWFVKRESQSLKGIFGARA